MPQRKTVNREERSRIWARACEMGWSADPCEKLAREFGVPANEVFKCIVFHGAYYERQAATANTAVESFVVGYRAMMREVRKAMVREVA